MTGEIERDVTWQWRETPQQECANFLLMQNNDTAWLPAAATHVCVCVGGDFQLGFADE